MGAAGEGSNRAWQLDFRAMTVRRRSGGAGVVLLSATPAKNSPLEFFNLIQYVDHEAFARQGIEDPEQFIDRYCKLETKVIVDMIGNARKASACVGFMNLHELRESIFRYGEFVTGEDVEKAGAPARHAAWLELTDKHSTSAEEIARVWGWGLADVEKGIQAARGLVPEVNAGDGGRRRPSTRGRGSRGSRRPRARSPWRSDDSATDAPGSICSAASATGWATRSPSASTRGSSSRSRSSRQIQLVGDDEQEAKRLEYVKEIEAMLKNPKLGNPLGLLALLSLVGIHPNLDDRKQVGVDEETGQPDVRGVLGVGERGDRPLSPQPQVRRGAGQDPRSALTAGTSSSSRASRRTCGFGWCWRRQASRGAASPSSTPTRTTRTIRPTRASGSPSEFNGTPEVTFTDQAGVETTFPAVPPKYDIVIANQVAYEGINLQTRTCAVHHVDLPWDPATLQQRNGRAWRQGNEFAGVEIVYYMAKCFPDSMKFTLIQGKRSWMADLIAGQARETNNPGAQMNMGPEEILAMIACDPVKARILFAAVEAKRKAEQDAKTAANASETLRTASFFFGMARAADQAAVSIEAESTTTKKEGREQYRVRPGDTKAKIAQKLGFYEREDWEGELDRENLQKRRRKYKPDWKPLKPGELLNVPPEWSEAAPEAGSPKYDRCGNAPREADQQLGRAERFRAEGEQRLSDLARIDPAVWPWGEWAPAARDHAMLVFVPSSRTEQQQTSSGGVELVKVYEKPVAPLYEGLRTKSPDSRDHRVLNFDEFGKVRDGWTIGARTVGLVEWRVIKLNEIAELHLAPAHRITDPNDWPADDDVRMDGVMRGDVLPKLARHLATTTEKVLRELNWVDATEEFLEKMWGRYGAEITSHLNELQDKLTLDAEKLEVPGVLRGVLTIGVKRRVDSILAPTLAGYQEFLAMAPASDERYDAVRRCARYWWGKGVPYNLLSGASDEQKAARAALLKAKKKAEGKAGPESAAGAPAAGAPAADAPAQPEAAAGEAPKPRSWVVVRPPKPAPSPEAAEAAEEPQGPEAHAEAARAEAPMPLETPRLRAFFELLEDEEAARKADALVRERPLGWQTNAIQVALLRNALTTLLGKKFAGRGVVGQGFIGDQAVKVAARFPEPGGPAPAPGEPEEPEKPEAARAGPRSRSHRALHAPVREPSRSAQGPSREPRRPACDRVERRRGPRCHAGVDARGGRRRPRGHHVRRGSVGGRRLRRLRVWGHEGAGGVRRLRHVDPGRFRERRAKDRDPQGAPRLAGRPIFQRAPVVPARARRTRAARGQPGDCGLGARAARRHRRDRETDRVRRVRHRPQHVEAPRDADADAGGAWSVARGCPRKGWGGNQA